jgi:hypothetical protein
MHKWINGRVNLWVRLIYVMLSGCHVQGWLSLQYNREHSIQHTRYRYWIMNIQYSMCTSPVRYVKESRINTHIKGIVADSVPGPYPCVFGPPESGPVSQRYGSGSGSFHHQAKIVIKTLIPTVLWLLDDFFVKLWKLCELVKHLAVKCNSWSGTYLIKLD